MISEGRGNGFSSAFFPSTSRLSPFFVLSTRSERAFPVLLMASTRFALFPGEHALALFRLMNFYCKKTFFHDRKNF
jgi:hypothetical protein